MSAAQRLAINWIEQGLVPDAVVRRGIRRLCERRLAAIDAYDAGAAALRTEAFIRGMGASPIALSPELANDQHYEVMVDFFNLVLGPHLKYSSAYWPEGVTDLGAAEAAGLAETVAHAALEDGQDVLEHLHRHHAIELGERLEGVHVRSQHAQVRQAAAARLGLDVGALRARV